MVNNTSIKKIFAIFLIMIAGLGTASAQSTTFNAESGIFWDAPSQDNFSAILSSYDSSTESSSVTDTGFTSEYIQPSSSTVEVTTDLNAAMDVDVIDSNGNTVDQISLDSGVNTFEADVSEGVNNYFDFHQDSSVLTDIEMSQFTVSTNPEIKLSMSQDGSKIVPSEFNAYWGSKTKRIFIEPSNMPSSYDLNYTLETKSDDGTYYTLKNTTLSDFGNKGDYQQSITDSFGFNETYRITVSGPNETSVSTVIHSNELVKNAEILPESSSTVTVGQNEDITFTGGITFNSELSGETIPTDMVVYQDSPYQKVTKSKDLSLTSEAKAATTYSFDSSKFDFPSTSDVWVKGGGQFVNGNWISGDPTTSYDVTFQYPSFSIASSSVSPTEATVGETTNLTFDAEFENVPSDGDSDTIVLTIDGADGSNAEIKPDDLSINGAMVQGVTVNTMNNGESTQVEILLMRESDTVSFSGTVSGLVYGSTGDFDTNIEFNSYEDSVANMTGTVSVSAEPIDSYIIDQDVTGSFSDTLTLQPDYNHEDGDVAYYYTKKTILRSDGTIVSESNWDRVQFDTEHDGNTNVNKEIARDINFDPEQTGEYSARVEVMKANSTYNWDEDGDGVLDSDQGWSDYTISKTGNVTYEFEVVSAGTTPSPLTALGNFFDDALTGIIDSIMGIFDTEPTAVPQPNNPPTPSSQP